jgi:peroxiredoxin family protein
VKRLAVIVSRGELNSVVQAATLIMAAVASGLAVRVFFRDEAISRITRGGTGESNLSDAYRSHETAVRERLAAQGLADFPALLRQIREAGDVRLYACSSSMAIWGVAERDLLPEIDGVRGITAFLLEDIGEADRVLTF